MSSVIPERLHALDAAELLDVVRQDQRDPHFVILDWTANTLSGRTTGEPDGLWRFHGRGRSGDAIRPWAVVLKILEDPANDMEPNHLWHRQREYLAHASGLLAGLPGHVAQPRRYAASKREGSAWLWMELVADTTDGAWNLADYGYAARQLGCFNGACATGAPLPNHPWLAQNHIETWLSIFRQDDVWSHLAVQQSFSAQLRSQVTDLWRDQDRFLSVLRRLPQCFSHFDYKRSNLFLRKDTAGRREVVAIDWGDCGFGALGGDLTRLVGASTFFHDWDAARVAELDAVAMQAYLDGLRDAGWYGDPELVRLAYVTWFALDWGCTAPGAVLNAASEENRADVQRIFGCTPEELITTIVALCEFALACGEEARLLLKRGDYPLQ